MKELLVNPLYQGLFTAGLMLLLLLSFRVAGKPTAGWNSTVLLILLYCLVNAGVGLSVSGIWVYILQSTVIVLLLIFFAVILANYISGKTYEEFGENAMIFLAPVIFYPALLLLLLIVRAFRTFV